MPSLNFSKLDQEYRKILDSTGSYLPTAFESALLSDSANLEGIEYTRAILWRLKTFYLAQKKIKEFIGKRYSAPASDFFVETVAFYLKVALKLNGHDLEVASERAIVSKRRALRPDITLWRGKEIIAAIECKTQLGWNRNEWRNDFLAREQRLSEYHPGAKLYFLALTNRNWSGLNDEDSKGRKFFVLLKDLWPAEVELEDYNIPGVNQRIELMFQEIFSAL